jgi:hypothetical protein
LLLLAGAGQAEIFVLELVLAVVELGVLGRERVLALLKELLIPLPSVVVERLLQQPLQMVPILYFQQLLLVAAAAVLGLLAVAVQADQTLVARVAVQDITIAGMREERGTRRQRALLRVTMAGLIRIAHHLEVVVVVAQAR